jgi:hypothetical protein
MQRIVAAMLNRRQQAFDYLKLINRSVKAALMGQDALVHELSLDSAVNVGSFDAPISNSIPGVVRDVFHQ